MPGADKKHIDLGVLAGTIGFPLRLAQIALFRDFAVELARLNVTPAVFSALEVLHRNPGMTQTRLAATIRLDRSSVVPLLDKLEKRGAVTREASKTDRRRNHIHLTAQGEALLAKAAERVLAHDRRMSERLAAKERRALVELLWKFVRAAG